MGGPLGDSGGRAAVDAPSAKATPDPRRRLGALGEEIAASHLMRSGYAILARNFRTRWGELDIVATNGDTLVFCEVKTRRVNRDGRDPLESVHARKQLQLRRMAGQWLAQSGPRRRMGAYRFDAIGITLDADDRLLRLDHLEAAF
ncbi:MAG TPA: YraN family protein [Solirubrobacteraceae bacterium]|nr:YraN family protein [Solirubrobacteraceae bacterium]